MIVANQYMIQVTKDPPPVPSSKRKKDGFDKCQGFLESGEEAVLRGVFNPKPLEAKTAALKGVVNVEKEITVLYGKDRFLVQDGAVGRLCRLKFDLPETEILSAMSKAEYLHRLSLGDALDLGVLAAERGLIEKEGMLYIPSCEKNKFGRQDSLYLVFEDGKIQLKVSADRSLVLKKGTWVFGGRPGKR